MMTAGRGCAFRLPTVERAMHRRSFVSGILSILEITVPSLFINTDTVRKIMHQSRSDLSA
jgi:hypothetical protein